MDDIIKISLYIIMIITVFIFSGIISKHKSFNFLDNRGDRYGSIDGLRGYLAISVFVHHFMLTWYWKNSGHWYRPHEVYFQNIGIIGVMLFFMITGFLFTSKIIRDRGRVDWIKLYKSRFFRIYPLYFFAILLITIVVFYTIGFENIDISTLSKQYIKWIFFHGENIHTHNHTPLIIAGVDWTLKYEWLFYFSLPFIALLLHLNRWFIFIVVIFALNYFWNDYKFFSFTTIHLIFFIVGAITAFIYNKFGIIQNYIKYPIFSILAIVALVYSIFYKDIYSITPILLISFFFLTVALGNSMFGLLKHKSSLLLGEISYSIYLLHGFLIYLIFTVFEAIDLKSISSTQHTIMLPFISIFVVLFAAFTYIKIEAPAIAYGKKR